MDKTPPRPSVPARAGQARSPAQPAASARPPARPIPPWQAIVDRVRQYVVRISTPNGHGTGFLFAQSTDLWGIGTAAHVVRHEHAWEQPIRIEHLESKTEVMLHRAERAIVTRPTDAAAIVMHKGTIPFPKMLLPLIDPTKLKRVGVEIGWLGYPALGWRNDRLCFFSGRISCLIQEESSYLVDGVAIHGVSGGPAFTQISGEIFGIVTSYIPNLVQGQTLPGLASVCDVTELQSVVQRFNRLVQAQAQQTPPAQSQQPPPNQPPPAQGPRPPSAGPADQPQTDSGGTRGPSKS